MSSIGKFAGGPGAGRRKAIAISESSLVTEGFMSHADGRPAWPPTIEPRVRGVDLVEWARAQRTRLERVLVEHGAILLRGFDVDGSEQFERVIAALSDGALEYVFRASPRTRVSGNIYTSTDYPADQAIFPHNEHAYSPRFPLRLFFYCDRPAASGGQTPIGPTREVLRRIDPAVRAEFERREVLYVRNYGDGFGLPWTTVFQTADRAEVEAYCASVGIEAEWKAGDRLRTRQRGAALMRHPLTGEAVWFNHATFFHVSTLPEAVRRPLQASFTEEDLPTQTYYGDGGTIDARVLDHLRAAYMDSLVRFDWRRGDVLWMDNMLCVHGREPFEGERRVLTGMAHAVLGRDLVEGSVD